MPCRLLTRGQGQIHALSPLLSHGTSAIRNPVHQQTLPPCGSILIPSTIVVVGVGVGDLKPVQWQCLFLWFKTFPAPDKSHSTAVLQRLYDIDGSVNGDRNRLSFVIEV
jgi:hypothetical protein